MKLLKKQTELIPHKHGKIKIEPNGRVFWTVDSITWNKISCVRLAKRVINLNKFGL